MLQVRGHGNLHGAGWEKMPKRLTHQNKQGGSDTQIGVKGIQVLALPQLLKASTEFTPLEEGDASCALCQGVSAY